MILLACAPPAAIVEDPPTRWEYPADPGADDLPPETLAAGLEAGVALLAALDPIVLHAGYDAALAHATRDCPSTFDAVGVTTGWSNECSTPDGWGFAGRAQAAWLEDADVEDAHYDRYGEFITTAVITHTGDATLTVDGRGLLTAWTDADVAYFESMLLGTFGYAAGAGDWMEPGWLDGGPSVSVTTARSDDGAGARRHAIDGGVSFAAGLPAGIVSVGADALAVSELDGVCAATGTVVLRGDEGQIYRFAVGDCAPCGAFERDGVALGEACADLAGFAGWEARPW